jgi:hypothetical protein
VDAALGEPAQTIIIAHCLGASYVNTDFSRAALASDEHSPFSDAKSSAKVFVPRIETSEALVWDQCAFAAAAAAASTEASNTSSHVPSLACALAPYRHAGPATGRGGAR